jgi:hypothetical protein
MYPLEQTLLECLNRILFFNGNIGTWNTKSAINIGGMFSYAASFSNVSSVQDFGYMFAYASGFNGDISRWNINIKLIWIACLYTPILTKI